MKKIRFQAGEWKRHALAVAAGLVWAAAFPKFDVAGLGWVVPGLVLVSATGMGGGAAFRIGYVAGLAHFLASLNFLLLIPVGVFPMLGWVALSGYLALYPAVWVWLCWRIFPAPLSVSQGGMGSLVDQFLTTSGSQRMRWAAACAVLWVSLEMAQARLLSGFAWNFLGVSQHAMLPVIQVAELTGVYGVSFVMAWFSVALIGLTVVLARHPARRTRWLAELMAPGLAVLAVVWFGFQKLVQPEMPASTLKLALVQPSVPQRWDRDAVENEDRFRKLIDLSRQALTNHPDLLVWPEAAVPYMVRHDEEIFTAVTNLVRTHQTWLVLGSDDAETRSVSPFRVETNFFNSAFLVSPEGRIGPAYRKRRLVMFGEYYPMKRWLPFMSGLGEFTAGERVVVFELPDHKVKISPLICFEDIFPHLVREYVEDDTDFVLNLTNNGWFGEGAAQWQHAANAVFRAVENGVPLVRCANNGLTCWVDSRGRNSAAEPPRTGDIYGAGFKIVNVPLLGGTRRTATFYRKHGDVFGWSGVAVAVWIVGAHGIRRGQVRSFGAGTK